MNSHTDCLCCLLTPPPRGHFTSIFLPGAEVSAPKFSLCLPVPFTREKAARAGVSAQLASFLLYSLSPFHPNPDILENKDLLTELTKQYKVSPSSPCRPTSSSRCWRVARTPPASSVSCALRLPPARRSSSCRPSPRS